MKINLNQIDFSRLEIEKIELIGFLAGVKPALLNGVYDVELTKLYLTKISKENLYFAEVSKEELKEIYQDKKEGVIGSSKQKWLAISRNKRYSEELIESCCNDDIEKTGRLLGYPKCCVKQYLKDLPRRTTIQKIFKRTVGQPIYYTNDVFNLQTRLKNKDGPNLQRLGEINASSGGYPFYLIFHIPCSYSCQESIQIGKKTLRALKKICPRTAAETEKILKKPILFLDNFHWITFDGFAKKNDIFYQSVSPPLSLIEDKILERIKKGDKISLKEGEVTVFNNGRVINHLILRGLDPVILNFPDT